MMHTPLQGLLGSGWPVVGRVVSSAIIDRKAGRIKQPGENRRLCGWLSVLLVQLLIGAAAFLGGCGTSGQVGTDDGTSTISWKLAHGLHFPSIGQPLPVKLLTTPGAARCR
jgi:hypothetical protein